MQASGSSAFTWKIGILKPRARPLAYDVEYDWRAVAVKPIWLFAMMWTVPPTS